MFAVRGKNKYSCQSSKDVAAAHCSWLIHNIQQYHTMYVCMWTSNRNNTNKNRQKFKCVYLINMNVQRRLFFAMNGCGVSWFFCLTESQIDISPAADSLYWQKTGHSSVVVIKIHYVWPLQREINGTFCWPLVFFLFLRALMKLNQMNQR